MGPGNDDRRLNSPESALAPEWRTDQRYGTCAHVRIRAQTPQTPGPKRDGLLAKRLWDRRKDEWTPGNHSTRQNFEKQYEEAASGRRHPCLHTARLETTSRISPALPQASFYTRLKILGSGGIRSKNHSWAEPQRFSRPPAGCVCRRLVASTCKVIGPGMRCRDHDPIVDRRLGRQFGHRD